MNELAQLRQQLAQVTTERDTASRDAHIFQAARAHNIDPETLARLAGDTPEAIGANAKRIAAGVAPTETPDQAMRRIAGIRSQTDQPAEVPKPSSGFDGGARPVRREPESPDDAMRRAAGY
ncbi:MAG TPA: hypothetical protein VII01_01165 [Solirubrobacteraceae bacterium]